ncbi:MAG: hypothetical protein OHK0013_43760 [Sandaracinaceae bacterium]
MSLELYLRRSPLDPWLKVVLRLGAQTGCGLGLVLTAVALGVAVLAFDVTGLVPLVVIGLFALTLPMTTLPLFVLIFLRLNGRRLSVTGDDVVLRRTDGAEITRATIASVRASVRKGAYAAWGRRGLVLHLGVGPKALAIGALDPERASRAGWPVASPPELEVSAAELDALLDAIGLERPTDRPA